METKAFYLSKTFWFNVLAAIWFWVGPYFGIAELSPELFATILTVGNVILRAVTKGAISIS